MYKIKESTVENKTPSTHTDVWKNMENPLDMFVELLKSSIPVAYVDVTYNFMFNIIPQGIFRSIESGEQNIQCSYSRCKKVGTKQVAFVSYKNIAFKIYSIVILTLIFF